MTEFKAEFTQQYTKEDWKRVAISDGEMIITDMKPEFCNIIKLDIEMMDYIYQVLQLRERSRA